MEFSPYYLLSFLVRAGAMVSGFLVFGPTSVGTAFYEARFGVVSLKYWCSCELNVTHGQSDILSGDSEWRFIKPWETRAEVCIDLKWLMELHARSQPKHKLINQVDSNRLSVVWGRTREGCNTEKPPRSQWRKAISTFFPQTMN